MLRVKKSRLMFNVNIIIYNDCISARNTLGYQNSSEAQQAGRLVKKLMKISIFRIQLFSDTVTFRSHGLCQRAGGWSRPPDKFRRKSWGGWEKLGGVQPPQSPRQLNPWLCVNAAYYYTMSHAAWCVSVTGKPTTTAKPIEKRFEQGTATNHVLDKV